MELSVITPSIEGRTIAAHFQPTALHTLGILRKLICCVVVIKVVH